MYVRCLTPLSSGAAVGAVRLPTRKMSVREALAALKAEESKGAGGAPFGVEVSLACVGCGVLPSEMGNGREKHPICPICRELKILTTYWCDVNCPGNPDAWKRHVPVHKEVRRRLRSNEDGGLAQ